MKRAVILFLAVLFLVTSLSGSGYVIWQMRQESKKKEQDKASQEALKKLNEDNKAKDQTAVDNNNPSPTTPTTKLEGTAMPDFTPTSEPVTSLQIQDIVVGEGAEATAASKITAHYTGALVSTGVIFQSSKDTGNTFTSPLSGLIAGWQQGIPGMKVGGKRRLTIPYAQAYGERGSGNIPPNCDLVFDIELVNVE